MSKESELELHNGKLFSYETGNKFMLQDQFSSVTQSCPALCDGSLPGSSVHGILQARILEWVAIPFSSGSS